MTTKVVVGKCVTAALIIFTAPPSALAHAIGRCSSPQSLAIQVTVQSVPLSMRTDFDAAEIRAMAPGQHNHAPLGFYRHDVGYRLAVSVSRPIGELCPEVTVDAELVEVQRDIEIARDLRENQCQMRAVVQHYRLHADASDAALRRAARELPAKLRWTMLQSLGTENNASTLKNDLRGKLGGVLDDAIAAFSRAAPAIRDAVDARSELQKRLSGCSNT